MCFTRSQFFASARKRKIIQNMMFLRGIMQVSVRNLRVLRCVLTRHARKPLFLRGIVHVRYVEIAYKLFKNSVFYEVWIFRLWRANRKSFKNWCFYDGSCISFCEHHVFYDVFLTYTHANLHFFKGFCIYVFLVFRSNIQKTICFTRCRALPKCCQTMFTKTHYFTMFLASRVFL